MRTMVRMLYESERLMADLDRRPTIDNALSPVNSRISSNRTALKRDGSTGMTIRGGDGASIGDYLRDHRQPDEEAPDLYQERDEVYKGEGILPKMPTTRPTNKNVDLRDLYKKPGKGVQDLEEITNLYQVDKQGKLQPDKKGFNNFMSDKLYEACTTYFSNVGKSAKPNDGAHAAQRQGMSKAGYNLTDMTGTFYDVANGKLNASKQGFSAYMNLSLTNAAFQYFGNVGNKAPAGYLAGNKSTSAARYLPSGKK